MFSFFCLRNLRINNDLLGLAKTETLRFLPNPILHIPFSLVLNNQTENILNSHVVSEKVLKQIQKTPENFHCLLIGEIELNTANNKRTIHFLFDVFNIRDGKPASSAICTLTFVPLAIFCINFNYIIFCQSHLSIIQKKNKVSLNRLLSRELGREREGEGMCVCVYIYICCSRDTHH